MLPTQIISIPFTGGLDTKSSWPTVNAANFLELENAVFTKTGALRKRWGYDALGVRVLGATTKLGTLVGGATANNEVLAFESAKAYAYMPDANRWADRGVMSSAPTTTQKVVAPSSDATVKDVDVARDDGLNAYTWVQDTIGASGQDVWIAITDDAGRRYMLERVATNVTYSEAAPTVVVFAGYFVALWRDGTDIKYRRVKVTSPTDFVAAASSFLGDVETAGNSAWDVAVIGDYLFFAYGGDDGVTPGLYLRRFDDTLTEQAPFPSSPLAVLGYTPVINVSLFTDWQRRIWISWATDDGVNDMIVVTTHDYSFTGSVSATACEADATLALGTARSVTGIVADGANVATIVYDYDASDAISALTPPGASVSPYVTRKVTVTAVAAPSAGVAGTPTDMWRSLGIESQPFIHEGTTYIALAWGGGMGGPGLQPTYFVADLDSGKFTSKYANLTGVGHRSYRTAKWASKGTGQFLLGHPERGRLIASGGNVYPSVGVSSTLVDFASYNRVLSADVDTLLVAGGLIQSYDGSGFTEQSPMLFPEVFQGVSAVAVGSGGSLSAGTYQYKFVYELVDARGLIRRSAPSQAIDVTCILNDSVNLTIPVLHATSSFDSVNIVAYRTKADEDIFYRVWTAAAARTAGLVQVATDDMAQATDTIADSTIDGNETLYTTGGYLESISPPSCTTIVSYKGRAVIAGTPEPNRIWFSKLTYPGIAVGFNDQLTIDVDPDGGPITALGVLDDKLIVFKHSRCYFVQGNGPDDTAQGFDFFPQLLSADVGCSEPGSVVAVPGGLMFKSAKGIYAISSGLSVSYVGAPVEAFNSTEIVSATLVPDRDMVLFISATGKALAFDYAVNKWSTFTNHDGVWSGIDRTTNKLVLFRSSGRVQRQSDTAFTDAGKFIPLKVVTGWLAQGEILGWQRVQRLGILGEYKGNHNLRVRFGYDYLKPYTQEVTIPVSTIITTTTYGTGTYGTETPYGGSYPAERFAVQLKKQKCLSVRVSIEDIQTSGYNEGLVLSGIAFRVGAKAGFNKQSHDRKIGAV